MHNNEEGEYAEQPAEEEATRDTEAGIEDNIEDEDGEGELEPPEP